MSDTVTLLEGHALHRRPDGRYVCRNASCNWSNDRSMSWAAIEHRTHLAAVIDAHYADQMRAAGEQALRDLADEHERLADSLAITFQDADARRRATWPHRWLAHIIRTGLGDLRSDPVHPDAGSDDAGSER